MPANASCSEAAARNTQVSQPKFVETVFSSAKVCTRREQSPLNTRSGCKQPSASTHPQHTHNSFTRTKRLQDAHPLLCSPYHGPRSLGSALCEEQRVYCVCVFGLSVSRETMPPSSQSNHKRASAARKCQILKLIMNQNFVSDFMKN